MARTGRPRSDDPTIQRPLSLTRPAWEWLALWYPDGNDSDRARELFERAMKFWPHGPDAPNPKGTTAKARPGGVVELRRRVKALEARTDALEAALRAAGLGVPDPAAAAAKKKPARRRR